MRVRGENKCPSRSSTLEEQETEQTGGMNYTRVT